jgi:hypothetical protein
MFCEVGIYYLHSSLQLDTRHAASRAYLPTRASRLRKIHEEGDCVSNQKPCRVQQTVKQDDCY